MRRRRVALEALLGRQVHDRDGVAVGRIHDVLAEREGEELVVREWQLGTGALVQRLGLRALSLFGIAPRSGPVRVPWEQMDLSDPLRPRLRCCKDELPASRP